MDRRVLVLTSVCAILGCGEDGAPALPVATVAACVAPEVSLPDGSCIRPGIPPGACAEGFVHDGEYGCEPVVPSEPCGQGLVAVPGDAACRPVMPCGDGKWGDIPVDAGTTYVDGDYAGGDSDGSADRPWTTVGEAVAAAAERGLIAIAEGSYEENVVISFRSARLWGICPERVEIVASAIGGDCPAAAVCVRDGGASGSEVHGLALRGPAIGLALSGAQDVLLDRLWIHDTSGHGITAENNLGTTSVEVVGSLVERSTEAGVFVMGSEARVSRSVVRATQPASDGTRGVGIIGILPCSLTPGGAVSCDPNAPAGLTISGSVIEQNQEIGVLVSGSTATIDATVVRGTVPQLADQTGGWGIGVLGFCTGMPDGSAYCDASAPSNVTITRSFVHQNHELGVGIVGSVATVETTVVSGTLPGLADRGRGIEVQLSCIRASNGTATCDPSAPSNAVVNASLVQDTHDVGLHVATSEATVSATVVRRTRARQSDSMFGDGISVVSELGPARAAVVDTRIANSDRAGLSSFGAHVSLSSVAIDCAAFALEGEQFAGAGFVFEDLGNNVCGCSTGQPPEPSGTCVAVSTGLAPPEPLGLGE